MVAPFEMAKTHNHEIKRVTEMDIKKIKKNVIIAGNGRERFKIELKFVEKLIF